MDAGSLDTSGNLAERYCDMLDVLGEIDPDELTRKIDRLTRLRDAVLALRGVQSGGEAGSGGEDDTLGPNDYPPPRPRAVMPPGSRRDRGFWPQWISLQLSGGAKTVGEIVAALPDKKPSDEVTCGVVLKDNDHLFRRIEGKSPHQWALVAKTREESVA